MDDPALTRLAAQLGAALAARGETLALAESCTGGWVAACVTAIAGSSAWFERGFVTYSNAAKSEALGVPPALIAQSGAVSEATAQAMAAGALAHSAADWSIAVTGVAGPGGGTPEKPCGTVCFAFMRREGSPIARTRLFSGDRQAVRRQSVAYALQTLVDLLEKG